MQAPRAPPPSRGHGGGVRPRDAHCSGALARSRLRILTRRRCALSGNVPKNNALASVAPADPDSVGLWAGYLASWTTWNHVRTVASLVSLSSLILGFCSLEH